MIKIKTNSKVVNNDSTQENSNVKSEHLSINNTLIVSGTEKQTVENLVPQANTSINETVKDIFMQNIKAVTSMNFNERNYNTRVNKTPSPDILKTIDDVALPYLQGKEKRSPSLIGVDNYICSAAVSVNQYLGQLIENKEGTTKQQPELPKWLNHLQKSISRTRRDIVHIMTINECRIKNQYTKKQIKLKDCLRKKFGDIKQITLDYKLILLKHDLKAKAEKMKHHRNMIETKRLDRKFVRNPKSVYRSMKGNNIEVKDMPSKYDIQAFWKSIWNVKIDYNTNTPWISELKTNN